MLRSVTVMYLVRQISQQGQVGAQTLSYSSSAVHAQFLEQKEDEYQSKDRFQYAGRETEISRKIQIGENVPRKDKINFLVNSLMNLKDSKEAVYGALDAWVAWEQKFPIGPLKRALLTLEKEQQWRRIVQVIKWMLSKGQANTMGTYVQLIRALDMDHRVDEAHEFWVKKIGSDLHSVPWQLCRLMISVYNRNNMQENLVKLFKGLEAFDRKPPEKSIVQKVANAYEILGMAQEKDRVLEKYSHLFAEMPKENVKRFVRTRLNKKEKSEKKMYESNLES